VKKVFFKFNFYLTFNKIPISILLFRLRKNFDQNFFQIHWKVVFIFFAYFDCVQVCLGEGRYMVRYGMCLFQSSTQSQVPNSVFYSKKKLDKQRVRWKGKCWIFSRKQLSNWISLFWNQPLEDSVFLCKNISFNSNFHPQFCFNLYWKYFFLLVFIRNNWKFW